MDYFDTSRPLSLFMGGRKRRPLNSSCEGLARRHKYSRMRYREEEEEDEARIK